MNGQIGLENRSSVVDYRLWIEDYSMGSREAFRCCDYTKIYNPKSSIYSALHGL